MMNMEIDLLTRSDVIEGFKKIIGAARPILDKSNELKVPPHPQNKYRRAGLNHQSNKVKDGLIFPKTHNKKSKSEARNEASLQRYIEEHPFVLKTPILYESGLYLDSIVSKPQFFGSGYGLKDKFIPDFLYVTTSCQVIKITLVEIESSTHKVFAGGINKKLGFHSDSMEGINQVRGWKNKMESKVYREMLFKRLEPLFEKYPVELFDHSGSVHKRTKIEIDYLLIVGRDNFDEKWKQDVVDDLYKREGILLMTYPVMIEELNEAETHKNTLMLNKHGFWSPSLKNHSMLPVKAPSVAVPSNQVSEDGFVDNDPFHTKLAGLGSRFTDGINRESANHPESLRRIFFRSGGLCEFPGCDGRIILNGRLSGGLSTIYNLITDRSGIEGLDNYDCVGLFCENHCENLNGGVHYELGTFHPLSVSLSNIGPYRKQADEDRRLYSKLHDEKWLSSLVSLLDVFDQEDHQGISGFKVWMTALKSTPRDKQMTFWWIYNDFYGVDGYRSQAYPAIRLKDNFRVSYLLRSGLLYIGDVNSFKDLICPSIMGGRFLDLLFKKYGRESRGILMSLCYTDVSFLKKSIELAGQ